MRKYIVILTLVFSLAISSMASGKVQWRQVSGEIQGRSLTDARTSDGVEIYQRSGVIIIKTQHIIQVKVFTILGQLVSQATLQPGASELRLNRGIYLVKTGNITQKVAI
ncbi:MAG: T9SS type A sorting domain-containing protein [Muribaculaceae bacterium]|nr:T9SS type A sorting domain-containing protein [Muribaculaceae bacterium]